ncbi:hypothetical protein KFE96_03990 [Kordiimonas sp. SCSIO 12603]|uniref:DUF6058 family natural product biosynthesis protein n=1 Tax=Kordiimonas sp. SCSIO 12603 TaxID=2829596 RepID=UPI0021068EA8|nr:DUF6058 family natural product biosynthesis protein [Kordiimonas sp. SCSIO 12603]UTW59478.1 hypothetical protein KFE96_03990 [Kordiimonas sp. SCSIO 12603]
MDSALYIKSNYLTLEDVAVRSGISDARLIEMIEAGCLPHAAYRLEQTYEVSSIFGQHNHRESKGYYPYSHVEKAAALLEKNKSWDELAIEEKERFRSIYKVTLEEHRAADFGMAEYFKKDGEAGGEAFEVFIASEWQHYLDGTYGLCTKTASAREIALKEVMIAKIKYLLTSETFSEIELTELEKAVDTLDAVSAEFAPHERERSSRGQYIDAVRAKYFQ